MLIAVNGRVLENAQPAGPELFTYNILKELLKIGHDDKFLVYCKNPDAPLIKTLTSIYDNVTPIKISPFISWTHVGATKQLFKDKPDIYFSTEHTTPFLAFLLTNPVTMIHGLEYKTNNQLSKKSFKYVIHPWILKYVCLSSKKIIVPSEYVKSSLISEHFIKNENKVYVIREGVDESFSSEISADEAEIKLNKLNIKYRYVLFVSTLQPRKNVSNTVRAYAKAVRENNIPNDIKLVLVGKVGWNSQDIFNTIKEEKMEERVIHLGRVEQEYLPTLFRHAIGFVNFSYEEGFGLPLLEAMTSGIPVAVSNIPAHKELAENTAIFANPTDIESMKVALIKLTNDTFLPEKKLEAINLAAKYSWEEAAKKHMDLFRSLV